MGKVAEFFSKWAFVIFLCVIAVMLLFAVGCCIYTAVINPFVGSVGTLGALFALATAGWWIWAEIKMG